MSDMNVGLVVALQDLVSGAPANKLKQAFSGIALAGQKAGKDFGNAIKTGFSEDNIDLALEENERKLQRARGRLQGALAMAASIAIPVKLAADFEEAFIDFANVAEIPLARQKEIEALLVEASRETGKSKMELLQAVGDYVGKGMDLESSLQALLATGTAASATKSDISDMANSGFAVMDNLKIQAKDLAIAFDVMALSGKEGSFELKAMARKFPEITAGARSLKMEGLPAVAALSSALQLAMKAAGSEDQAATNLSNFLGKITAPDTVKKFAKFGVNIEKEMKIAQKKGVDVLDHMLTIIADKTGGDAFKMGELFADKQVLDFLRAIIPNLEEYRRQRDKVVKADGSTIAEDFGKTAQGMNFMLRETRNALSELTGASGGLLPVIKDLVYETNQLIYGMSNFTAANPELTAAIVKTVAGLMAFGAVTRLGAFALATIRGPLIKTIALFLKFDDAGKNISIAAKAFGILRTASVLGFGGIAVAAKSTLALFAGLVGAITWPIAGVVAVLAGAGLLIHRYWEPISNFASGFAAGVWKETKAAGAAITGFIGDVGAWTGEKLIDFAAWLGADEKTVRIHLDAIKAQWSAIGNWIVSMFAELPGRVGDWFSGLFAIQDYSERAEGEFRNAGERAGAAFVDMLKVAIMLPVTLPRAIGVQIIEGITAGLEDGVAGLLSWFAALPVKILQAIGNIDLTSAIKWPSLPAWLGGGSSAEKEPSISDRAGAKNPKGSLDSLLGNNAPLPNNAPAPVVNHLTENKPKISVVNNVKVDKGANAAEIARQLGAQTAKKTRLALSDAGVN